MPQTLSNALNNKKDPKPLNFSMRTPSLSMTQPYNATGHQTSTPIGYYRAPSLNPLSAAYGGTRNVPLPNQASTTPGVYKPPVAQPASAGANKSDNHSDVMGILEKVLAARSAQIKSQTTSPNSTPISQAPPGQQYGDSQGNPSVTSHGDNPPSVPDYSQYGLYGQIFPQYAEMATKGSKSVEKAQKALTKFQTGTAQKLAETRADDIPLEFNQGRAQVLQQAAAEKEKALQTGVSNALTEQQQKLTALGTLGNQVAPQLGQYGQTFYTPGANMFSGSGAGGAFDPVADTPRLAQQVANGQMTIDQANSLIGNNPSLLRGLNEAVTRINPNFNFTQSAASASTQAQGQQLQTAAHATVQALDSLQTLYNNLPGVQTGGIPATNSIANWIASHLGSSALTQYNQTLHDARAQLQGVLTASGGATPTGAESMALTYLPDNMTPAQFSSAVANIKNLVQQKVSSFTQSGQQGGGFSGGGGLWSW